MYIHYNILILIDVKTEERKILKTEISCVFYYHVHVLKNKIQLIHSKIQHFK